MATLSHAEKDTSGLSSSASAYLEFFPEQGASAERIVLPGLPFTVGRADGNDHTIGAAVVSKLHAVFFDDAGRYAVRDLGSTNGTFVNGVRVTEQQLGDGDIVHFGPIEFRFRAVTPSVELEPSVHEPRPTRPLPLSMPRSMIQGAPRLRELIDLEAIQILYQPIVDLDTGEVLAYEALARGTHPELMQGPTELLQLAEECGLVIELSQVFRRLAVVHAGRLPEGKAVFLNIHPVELHDPSFVASLHALKAMAPKGRPLVLEIAEASVTNLSTMSQIRDAFCALGFQFAYDDFGAGQARFLELTDIPPHYLKLDMRLIQGLEEQRPRQELVRALLSVVGALGVRVIAEGIETPASAAMCRLLGCKLGQGFLFGRPSETGALA